MTNAVTPEEQELNGLVREKVAEVERAAKRYHMVEVAVVVFAAVCILVAAALGAWNTYRIRGLGQRIEHSIDLQQRNQEAIQHYNTGHAQSGFESHQTIVDLQVCVSKAFAKFPNIVEEEVLACFRPATPPPVDGMLPSEKEKPDADTSD